MARIVVIDDDPDLLATLTEMLGRAGHKVFAASSAPGGLREYRQHGADVVITDRFIPDPDGLALIRELGSEVKIIAMSGGSKRGEPDVLQDAQEFGAWRALSKPFVRNELLALIEEAVTP